MLSDDSLDRQKKIHNLIAMRIIHSLEGTSWSGGQAQAFFLAKRQAELGHEVLLMCQKDSALQKKAENAGISICPVDYFKEINLFLFINY